LQAPARVHFHALRHCLVMILVKAARSAAWRRQGFPHSNVRTFARLLPPALLKDVRQLIEGARGRAAAAVNSEMVRLYWSIGERIRKDILAYERAAYGEQIVHALSRQLSEEYGLGFGRTNLFYMIRFAETFPDSRIVHALSEQLPWTHLRQIIYLDDPLQREFYTRMCRIERWSTRTLQDMIQGMLYERTAISRKPAHLARKELDALRDEDRVSPDLVFRDPYLLDFLGLRDTLQIPCPARDVPVRFRPSAPFFP